MDVTLGGDRLGAGGKMKVDLKTYNRSTHDLGYVWRSTMAAGTLVPFMTQIALPGDSWDIDLDADIMTHPTIGPLFGSYKVQLDVFTIPLRLYQAKVQYNALNIGKKMSEVYLPTIQLRQRFQDTDIELQDLDNWQVNPSSIFAYLGIRGIGVDGDGLQSEKYRDFMAGSLFAYGDIFKNYYANKQEEYAYMVHNNLEPNLYTNPGGTIYSTADQSLDFSREVPPNTGLIEVAGNVNMSFVADFETLDEIDPNTIYVLGGSIYTNNAVGFVRAVELFENVVVDYLAKQVRFTEILEGNQWWPTNYTFKTANWYIDDSIEGTYSVEPRLVKFPLEDMDRMRMKVMAHIESGVPLNLNTSNADDWGVYWANLLHQREVNSVMYYSRQSNQDGLLVKTYQSDMYNNWVDKEAIDGENGVNKVTAIQVDSEGKFTFDQLMVGRKVYDMLYRIMVSDGSYDSWQDVTYTHERMKQANDPVYAGGLSKELVFQEVVSNSASLDQPLGTLAGRGKLSGKHKGGHVKLKIHEPSYVFGMVSLTPRIDYSQGNAWDVNLKTWNDLHKPGMDEIGFEDLVTDQMAWWDTQIIGFNQVVYKSAGKRPAWMNYMTNVNITRGNFAKQTDQMFMTLNRRYEPKYEATTPRVGIKDVTTYIDPVKFNHIFADTRRDAQNFWVQIAVDITARRIMSAKVMPNL